MRYYLNDVEISLEQLKDEANIPFYEIILVRISTSKDGTKMYFEKDRNHYLDCEE